MYRVYIIFSVRVLCVSGIKTEIPIYIKDLFAHEYSLTQRQYIVLSHYSCWSPIIKHTFSVRHILTACHQLEIGSPIKCTFC